MKPGITKHNSSPGKLFHKTNKCFSIRFKTDPFILPCPRSTYDYNKLNYMCSLTTYVCNNTYHVYISSMKQQNLTKSRIRFGEFFSTVNSDESAHVKIFYPFFVLIAEFTPYLRKQV